MDAFKFFKRKADDYSDASSEKHTENPYLNARRSWNEHVGAMAASRQAWQLVGLLSLIIALAGVGGVIYIGSLSKFVPYVVEVDKTGQTIAIGPVFAASKADPRVVHATVADFVASSRMVTPDVALQRKAVFRVYGMLSPNDPATPKMTEHMNKTEESNPFNRAAKEIVSIQVKSVIPQSPDTWQVDWIETIRDRQGVLKEEVPMRSLVTVYTAEPTAHTTDEQLRNNPLGIYVRDFSWARIH
jgi:type IV secretion system protein VirB5